MQQIDLTSKHLNREGQRQNVTARQAEAPVKGAEQADNHHFLPDAVITACVKVAQLSAI